MCMPRSSGVLIVFVALMLGEAPIQAYLDPGSGSMLLQVLLGGFAAVGVIARFYWKRLTCFFRKKNPQDCSTDTKSES